MTSIAFPITAKCEENCAFCFINPQPDISLKKFQKLLTEALEQDPSVNKIVITGGNPELNPDFFAICEEVKKHNLLLKVHSNYYNKNTWEKYLVLVDEVSIPVDSLAGNDFRSHKSVQNYLAALKFFLDKITIQVHTVASQRNLHELQMIENLLNNLAFFPHNSWKIFRLIGVNNLSTYELSDQDWEHVIKTFAKEHISFVDDVLHYSERFK